MAGCLDTDLATADVNRSLDRRRGVHDVTLCVDHLAVPFARRVEVARMVQTTRTQLTVAVDARRWAFDHLWNRRLDQVVAPAAPPPLDADLFLARPWSGHWRWATTPRWGPTSGEGPEGDTTLDHVIGQLGEAGRAQLVDLVAGADDTVRECHLDRQSPGGRDGAQVPAVILARRLGATEDPLVVGVWIAAVPAHDGSD